MTPNEILEDVKGRILSLLHSEDEKVQPLLRQALGAYQDKAGVKGEKVLEENDLTDGTFPVPEDLLVRANCKDARGRFIRFTKVNDVFVIRPVDLGRLTFPITFTYLVNLRDCDFNFYEVPATAVGLISDYLEVLIQKPDAERKRRIASAGNLDTSDIPSEESLHARKMELELAMKQARSSLSSVML